MGPSKGRGVLLLLSGPKASSQGCMIRIFVFFCFLFCDQSEKACYVTRKNDNPRFRVTAKALDFVAVLRQEVLRNQKRRTSQREV